MKGDAEMIPKGTLRKRSFSDLRRMFDFLLLYTGRSKEKQERGALVDTIQRELFRAQQFIL